MFDYLTKFKQLPQELQKIVSSPEALGAIKDLEKKYDIDLAALVIKVMVKEVPWPGLADFLVAEHHLERRQAQALQQELARRVFAQVSRYLGIENQKLEVRSKKSEEGIKNLGIKTPITPERESGVFAQNLPQTIKTVLPAETAKKSLLAVEGLVENIMPQAIKLLGSGQASEQGKLKNILATFVKGIRDFISAREALMREPENGGLGLNKERAESMLKLVTKNKGGAGIKTAVPKIKTAPPAWEKVRDVEYDFSALAKNQADKQTSVPLEQASAAMANAANQKTIAPSAAPTEQRPAEIPPSAAEVKVTPSASLPAAAPARENKIKPAVSEFKESMLMQRRADKVEPDRPRLDDILKPPSRLQGPIEELANLDLVNFRRLGSSPETMASKIQNKIKLLEQESFTRRQQGISAWRHSPLYQLYINIGQAALASNKSVTDVLQEKSASADALTAEEFDAILELNRQLRI